MGTFGRGMWGDIVGYGRMTRRSVRAGRTLCCVAACAAGLVVATSAVPDNAYGVEPLPTALTICAPAAVSARESTSVIVLLEDSAGTSLSGQTIRLMESAAGTEALLASGTTDVDGRFSATVAPQSKLVLVACFDGNAEYAASRSEIGTVTPHVALSRPWTHDSFAYPGQWLPARGTLWPWHSAASTSTTIVCERLEGGEWVVRRTYPAKVAYWKGASRYAGRFRIPSTGTWRVRVRHLDAEHAETYATTDRIVATRWRDRYERKVVQGFRTKRKVVAITIDDGPNKQTLRICTILERYGARGTFFFTNKLLKRGYGKQAKAAYDRGHEIANHTANHKFLSGSYRHSLAEAVPARNRITRATGFAPIWIRGMGGVVDSTGLSVVSRTNQLYSNWSLDSRDSHQRYLPPNTVYHNVVDHVRPGDVILVHQTHPETVKALPRILRELRRRGYKVVTLSELAATSRRR